LFSNPATRAGSLRQKDAAITPREHWGVFYQVDGMPELSTQSAALELSAAPACRIRRPGGTD